MVPKDMPKACVILGAGASYDVRGGTASGEPNPPHAKNLFDHHYSGIGLGHFPEARFLVP